MAAITITRPPKPLHPLHSILLAFPVALFTGALLSDWAYSSSYAIQWTNFSSWLIAGGVLVGLFALLWSLIDLVRASGRGALYFLLLLAAMIVGLINALVHSKDAWASMPAGLYLSILATVLVIAAAWIGFSGVRGGDVQ